jgi:formylglycine-generating enzyme required for sulfatase activity
MIAKFVHTRNIIFNLGALIIESLLLIVLSGCGPANYDKLDTVPANTAQASAIYTPLPTNTSTPAPTQTLISATPTPDPMTLFGKDGATLLYVPEGEYSMGSDNSETDEAPFHTVFLDAFWIDKTEVTVRMYSVCVDAGVCKEPTNKKSFSHPVYYGNTEFENYPVIYVDWNMAKTYCEWAGRRLPTEAEWEKAARGTTANEYPWGNAAPSTDLLNYNRNVGDTTDVEKYLDGKSIYGALNMAGNVWEWVNDWYDEAYYQSSDSMNPLGPDSDTSRYRVLRGGSWTDGSKVFRSSNRFKNYPDTSNYDIGFRCALSVTP